MDYLCNTHYIIVALVVALVLKAVWHLNRREVSVKRIFLYKHLRDDVFFFLFFLFLRPCQWVEKRNIVWKEHLGSVAHLPAMLPCSFEDHLSVASLKCCFFFFFLQRRAVAALCELAIETVLEIRVRHSREACSPLPGQWARRRRSEKSIMKDQLLLTVEDVLQRKKEQKWFFFFL